MISIHKTMGFAMMLALGAGCAVGADDDFNTDDESVDSANSALEADERGGYATQSQAQAQVGQMGPSKLGLPPSKGLPSKGIPMLPSKGGLLPSKGEFPTKGLPSKGGYPTKGGYAQQGPAQLGQAQLGQAQLGQAGELSQAQLGQAQIGQAGPAQIGQAGLGQTGVVGQETGQREGERCIGGFGGFGWGGFGWGGFGGLGCGFGGGALVSSFTSCTTAFVPIGIGGFGGCGGFGGFGW